MKPATPATSSTLTVRARFPSSKMPLNPAAVENPDAETTEAGQILNRLLYGPQDYAVIAGK